MPVHRIGFSAKQGKAENQSLRLLEAPRRTNLNTTGKMCEPTHVCDFIQPRTLQSLRMIADPAPNGARLAFGYDLGGGVSLPLPTAVRGAPLILGTHAPSVSRLRNDPQ